MLRPHIFNREWGAGLSPRPASAQGRASRADERADPDDPSEIGRAITSDSGGGLRRRSRSLSGLQGLAGSQRAGRRRSDEIRYWRESYNPGFMSPLSSNAHDDVDDTGMVDISAPESPAAERPPRTPPQPFNFGLLSKEMLGMKITHAADMDMRLGGLESRTLHLERAVDKLCSTVPGVKRVVDRKDMVRPSSSRRSLETDTQSQASFGDYQTYTSSLQPPPYPAPKARPKTTTTPHPPSNRPPSGPTTIPSTTTNLPTTNLPTREPVHNPPHNNNSQTQTQNQQHPAPRHLPPAHHHPRPLRPATNLQHAARQRRDPAHPLDRGPAGAGDRSGAVFGAVGAAGEHGGLGAGVAGV